MTDKLLHSSAPIDARRVRHIADAIDQIGRGYLLLSTNLVELADDLDAGARDRDREHVETPASARGAHEPARVSTQTPRAEAGIPDPGEPGGPCADMCEHIVCVALRRIAAAACTWCRMPIGYGRGVHRDEKTADAYLHTSCYWIASGELT